MVSRIRKCRSFGRNYCWCHDYQSSGSGNCGVALPLLLDRMKVDPAVASGVFVTTITDVVGFFAFLGLASIFLL